MKKKLLFVMVSFLIFFGTTLQEAQAVATASQAESKVGIRFTGSRPTGSTSSEDDRGPGNSSNNGSGKLPQTGEKNNDLIGMLGILLLVILAIIYLKIEKKKVGNKK